MCKVVYKALSIKLETINKLCYALNCRIQDIFEYIPDKD
ncbi:hypothetical protein DBY21_10290 [Candidatus Gastranaerophilales bacterium]|nr:MAG: hypothetical protein DBY21_10290 [Candidatus Gastranaerophilales bacterium]